MSYSYTTRLGGVAVDRVAIAFVALLGVVIAGALELHGVMVAQGQAESAVDGMSAGEQATAGAVWAILEALTAAVLLGLVVVWKRLSDPVQSVLKRLLLVAGCMALGGYAQAQGIFGFVFVGLLGAILVIKLSDELGVWWAVNDVIVLGVAVGVAAWAGILLSPWVLAIGLIGLSVYDHVFANKQTWMFELMKPMVKFRLPVLFLVPARLRFDWESLAEEPDEDEDAEPGSDVAFGIGMADLALPAAFVVAIANKAPAGSVSVLVAAVAVGLGLACFRLSWNLREKGSGAGLPPLTGGALGGWVVGSVVMLA